MAGNRIKGPRYKKPPTAKNPGDPSSMNDEVRNKRKDVSTMTVSGTNHTLRTHTSEESHYTGIMPITYESVLNWYESVFQDKSGKWTTVEVPHDGHYVKIFLPICYSPAFQDIICHSVFCFTRIKNEMDDDDKLTPMVARLLFKKTLYSPVSNIWNQAFGTTVIDGAENLRQTIIRFLSSHGLVSKKTRKGIGGIGEALKRYLLDDSSLYRKPRLVPVGKIAWVIEHMVAIHRFISESTSDENMDVISNIQMEKALLYTMPDTWFKMYLEERDSLVQYGRNGDDGGMFYDLLHYIEKQEVLSARKSKEIAVQRRSIDSPAKKRQKVVAGNDPTDEKKDQVLPTSITTSNQVALKSDRVEEVRKIISDDNEKTADNKVRCSSDLPRIEKD